MKSKKGAIKYLSVMIFVLGISVILVGSIATAASKFQSNVIEPGGIEPSSETGNSGMNPNGYTSETLGNYDAMETSMVSLPGVNYFVIPPGGFTSDGNLAEGFFISFAGGYLIAKTDIFPCLVTPVNIPIGSTINSLEVRLNDNNESYGAWFNFYRINLETGTAEIIAEVSSPSGATGGLVSLIDDTVANPIVSDLFAYQLTTCLSPYIYVYGARIGYSHVSYMPLIEK